MYSFARHFMKLRLNLSEDETVMYIYIQEKKKNWIFIFFLLSYESFFKRKF